MRRTFIVSFILKYVRRRQQIELEGDALVVEGRNPLVVLGSSLLELIYDLESK
jgi:hypothetical protein